MPLAGRWVPLTCGCHFVHADGRVWSAESGAFLGPAPYVHLHGKGVYLATVVATAFLGPKPPHHSLVYLDGDRSNVRLDNLQWAPTAGRSIGRNVDAEVKALWEAGHSVNAIADDLGVTRHKVNAALRRLGLGLPHG